MKHIYQYIFISQFHSKLIRNLQSEISLFSSGGSFNSFWATTRDVPVWIIPSFRIWGYVLHVELISCVITNCGQHQWVTPSPLSIALGLTGGKYYQKITISIFRLILQNFAFPGCFSYIYYFESFLLLSFLLTFFRLVCYCRIMSMWLDFSLGISSHVQNQL